MRAIVIIPTSNKRDHIVPLVAAIHRHAPTLDILLIDDASADGTGEIAAVVAHQDPRVHVIHRLGKLGRSAAYRLGFRVALDTGYDLILQMDADFSHRPHDLPALLTAAATADVVVGPQGEPGGRVEGWSPLRNALARAGSFVARRLAGPSSKDATGGFTCFRREALAAIDLDAIGADGLGFQVALHQRAHHAGLRFAVVPSTVLAPRRTHGREPPRRDGGDPAHHARHLGTGRPLELPPRRGNEGLTR